MLISLTVGKVDAGVAVLLTQDKRLIEFPSILLPPHISSGSIVDITVARNFESESESQDSFSHLQDSIFRSFGESEPSAPVLRCRNATQTSIVLEWDPVQLATADVISLSLFRNGQKAGNIPQPTTMESTKISGLAVDTEYTFHLVLRTTAGTFASDRLTVRTHKMTDLSGITVTPGILPAQLRESLVAAVERIGGKLADTVRIDTTHFVTTEGRGITWEKAVEMNIPVVRPEWVEGCERGGRIVGVRQYYLDADPRQRMANLGPAAGQQATPAEPASAKDEAPLPALPNNNRKEQANGDEASEAGQTNNEKEEDRDEESEEDDSEDKKVEALDEQKVRVEDNDQHKVALRPAASPADEKEPSVDKNPVTKSPSLEVDADTEEGAKTPGAASFQDVAL
ncbi:Chitin biosynthesis protein chs5 [Pseudogymnoascus verrucosus]|uniref:Chitin biosynthesis protein chs5 n=1 Tax=Pseudogymnoascus verrucosus TaxID=342668 RepID=A0A1B8G6K7_9PEZI|nr:Chitin biosynthesis protein chs5 [Pseudogymnoascus verrucosus]OBT91464.1 Chitin biosynthesis protein chs5 [Pseudogymnoascus verrucosus]